MRENGNLFGQPAWQRRGADDSRLARHATDLTALTGRVTANETSIANLGLWVAYTPALTADTTSPTLGSGATQHGRYMRIGRAVWGTFIFHFGSGATAGTGNFRIGLPFQPLQPPADHYAIGTGYAYNGGNGNIASLNYYVGALNGPFCNGIIHEDVAAAPRFLGPAVPFSTGWGSGDRILGNFIYEAAS